MTAEPVEEDNVIDLMAALEEKPEGQWRQGAGQAQGRPLALAGNSVYGPIRNPL